MTKVAFGVAVACAAVSCTFAALLVGRRVQNRSKWKRIVGIVRDFEEGCLASWHRLRQVVDAMAVEMHAGLASEGGNKLKILAKAHYYDEDVVAAVILGTGTNACYVERADAITKCQGLLAKSGSMVINMEWGNFWSSHLPRTSYDEALDADSLNPGDQGFEKLVSGMYLGDIVRRVILRMAQESDLFGEDVPPNLMVPFVLRTECVSAMHQDESLDLRDVARIMNDVLGISNIPLRVRKLIVKVCNLVTQRAARLAAAGIVGILKKIGRDGSPGLPGGRMKTDAANKMKRTVIAVDGSLYEHYPQFRHYLKTAIVELLGEEAAEHVVIQLSKDGSGIGAALIAASHSIYLDN